MTSGRHDLGVLGEQVAASYLARQGYDILARNYRFGRREVDLIVSRGGVVAFVEVKTRAGQGYGHPLEAITALKRREVERVARAWKRENGRPGLCYRFDAVGIVIRHTGKPRVEHVPNAWTLGE